MKIDAEDVLRRLDGLAPSSAQDAWRHEGLVGNLSLGRFSDGSASMFFEVAPAEVSSSDRRTRALHLIESPNFSVVGAQSTQTIRRSGVVIMLRDPSRLQSFATLVAHAASKLEADPTCFAHRIAVDAYLHEWIEFFARDGLTADEAVGLWGELFVLSSMPDVEAAVPCWVGPYAQLFDFVGNGSTLEVKTSRRSSQVTISLDQVEGRDGGHLVFVRVLPDENVGLSLSDLVSRIRKKLKNPIDFERALMRVGYTGNDHSDLKLTAHEVKAIANPDIPRPTVDDRRVRKVRFSIDVDSLGSVPIEPLLRSVVGTGGPRRRGSRRN